MKYLFIVLSVMVAMSINCSLTFAEEEQNYPIDQWLENCMGKDPSNAGMVNCTYRASEMWDKELNTVYKELMKKLNPQDQKLLKDAETAWIKYREAELKLKAEINGISGGSIGATLGAGNEYDFVKTRAIELKEYLNK